MTIAFCLSLAAGTMLASNRSPHTNWTVVAAHLLAQAGLASTHADRLGTLLRQAWPDDGSQGPSPPRVRAPAVVLMLTGPAAKRVATLAAGKRFATVYYADLGLPKIDALARELDGQYHLLATGPLSQVEIRFLRPLDPASAARRFAKLSGVGEAVSCWSEPAHDPLGTAGPDIVTAGWSGRRLFVVRQTPRFTEGLVWTQRTWLEVERDASQTPLRAIAWTPPAQDAQPPGWAPPRPCRGQEGSRR